MHAAAIKRAAGVTLGLGLIVAVGCQSTGRTTQSEAAVTSLEQTRQELFKAQRAVDRTQQALNRLASASGDVQPAYKDFTGAVAEVQATADRARSETQAMRERGQAYMANWEKEMAQVSDPAIRSNATQRRAAVQANYEHIAVAATDVRQSYDPYLRDLLDIEKGLASDLTPGGVDGARPAIQRALGGGETLNQKLNALLAEVDRVYAGMATGSQSGTKP